MLVVLRSIVCAVVATAPRLSYASSSCTVIGPWPPATKLKGVLVMTTWLAAAGTIDTGSCEGGVVRAESVAVRVGSPARVSR